MKNKNNNQNEFERLGGQKSGGGGYIPPIPPPGSATVYNLYTSSLYKNFLVSLILCRSLKKLLKVTCTTFAIMIRIRFSSFTQVVLYINETTVFPCVSI